MSNGPSGLCRHVWETKCRTCGTDLKHWPELGLELRHAPSTPNAVAPTEGSADDNAAANKEALLTAQEIVAGDRVGIHVREVRLARALLRFEHINAMLRELLRSKQSAPSSTAQPVHPDNIEVMIDSLLTVVHYDSREAAEKDLRALVAMAATLSHEALQTGKWCVSSQKFDCPDWQACSIHDVCLRGPSTPSARAPLDEARWKFCMENGFPKHCFNPEQQVHYWYIRADVCPEAAFGWATIEQAVDGTMALMARADGTANP